MLDHAGFSQDVEDLLLEAGLAFLDHGIQLLLNGLGRMLNDSRNQIALSWGLPAAPGVTIFATALSVSLVGDTLSDRGDRTS